jgi:hypothetical protein
MIFRTTGLFTLRRLTAARAMFWLGQSLRSFPRQNSATFCQPWSLLRKALIRAAKPSYTAGTLCAIFSEYFLHYVYKILDTCMFFVKRFLVLIILNKIYRLICIICFLELEMDLNMHRLNIRKNMPKAYEYELKDTGKDRLIGTLVNKLSKSFAISKKKHYELLSLYIDLIAKTQDYSPIFDIKSIKLPLCWNKPKDWDCSYIKYEWGHLYSKSQNPDLEYNLENFGLYSARCNQHIQSSMNIDEVLVYGGIIAQRISEVLLKRDELFRHDAWKKILLEFKKLKK